VSRRVRLQAKEKAKEKQQEDEDGRLYRIIVNAPRNVWVRSSDVNVEIGLSEGFRVEYKDKTQMFGEAYVLRGRLDVIGRKFEVQKDSQVRFAGPAKQPWVNVTALHVNEREKVKVTVSVVGKGTDVTIKPTSDPPLPESDIYTLLATGRLNLQRGTGSSITADQAASVLGSLAASQLKSVMAKALPIDVVSIDSAASGGYRLELGKYLTDTLYLGYQGQLGADPQKGENPHAGKLELQMTKKWSLEAYAGTAPAFGADLVWSTDF
jgi:translocation and assembly module TamB